MRDADDRLPPLPVDGRETNVTLWCGGDARDAQQVDDTSFERLRIDLAAADDEDVVVERLCAGERRFEARGRFDSVSGPIRIASDDDGRATR